MNGRIPTAAGTPTTTNTNRTRPVHFRILRMSAGIVAQAASFTAAGGPFAGKGGLGRGGVRNLMVRKDAHDRESRASLERVGRTRQHRRGDADDLAGADPAGRG